MYMRSSKHRGIPIYVRLGLLSQEKAEQRLIEEIERVNALLQCSANRRPTFADCAARYLTDSKNKRSIDATAWHIRLLIPYVGSLDIHRIHDGTLTSFIADRIASGVTATTINRSLEVVRTILTRAARSYRDDDGRPWLETMPPLISMLPECREHPAPSPGMSRIDCSPRYPRAWRGWCSSPSTRDCARVMFAGWSGLGRFVFPRLTEA